MWEIGARWGNWKKVQGACIDYCHVRWCYLRNPIAWVEVELTQCVNLGGWILWLGGLSLLLEEHFDTHRKLMIRAKAPVAFLSLKEPPQFFSLK
jgi:hypothetical protein